MIIFNEIKQGDIMDLFNQNNIKNNSDSKNQILQQWILFSQMADSNSNRRNNTNAFFVTLHMAILGFSDINEYVLFLIGSLITIAWINLISSYRKQNKDKYEIINKLEKALPCSPYSYEYYLKNQRQGNKKYLSYTIIELGLSIIIFMVYVVNLFI